MIYKKTFLYYFLIINTLAFFYTPKSFCQVKPIIKQFSFGNYWSYPGLNKDRSLDMCGRVYSDSGIVFSRDSIFYKSRGVVNQGLFNSLLNSIELKYIILHNLNLPDLLYTKSIFQDSVYFDINKTIELVNDSIKNVITLNKLNFNQSFLLVASKISNNIFSEITNVNFLKYTAFRGSIFDNYIYLTNLEFDGEADFTVTKFLKGGLFGNVVFKDNADFAYSSFKDISFQEIRFYKNFNLTRSKFNESVSFARTVFSDTLFLNGTNFEQGVDFRRNDFDSVKAIVLEDIQFPDGKLYVNWDQIRGYYEPRICLASYTKDKNDDFKRIQLIYEKLRDNYLAQGNKLDADNVMYELGWQRRLLLGGFWNNLYWITFGYGYQPWRFAILIVVVIILFSFLWYWLYFEIAVTVVNPSIHRDFFPFSQAEIVFYTKEIKIFNRFSLKIYNHKKTKDFFNLLKRIWYCLFLSGSVLLSIKFKKNWIKGIHKQIPGYNSYIYVLTVEWILGFVLYILFGIFVLSSQFDFIKGLLGIAI